MPKTSKPRKKYRRRYETEDQNPIAAGIAASRVFTEAEAADRRGRLAGCIERATQGRGSYEDWDAILLAYNTVNAMAGIPGVIDGDESANDALLADWPLPRWFGAPVWHLHESLERLERLASEWPRVCIGSSGEFSTVGTQAWWTRMYQAMRVICDDMGRPG